MNYISSVNVFDQQTLHAKQAEARRPFYGESILSNSGLATMFRERAEKALADLTVLEQDDVLFAPFLEIGAGSGQRSVAVANKFSASGVATDISQESLRNAPFVLTLFGYDTLPMLICCDAHHLPFLANTFRFVFGYRVIHHFRNPAPVVKECHRVLARGGRFFLNEEPLDSAMRRVLRGNRLLSHPPTRLQGWGYKLGVERLFWDNGAHERSLGMTEARFDIGVWRETLSPFGRVEVEINRKLRIRSDFWKPALNTFLSSIVGGNVKALCTKTDGEETNGEYRERLMCLDCYAAQITHFGDNSLQCNNCGRSYPLVGNVVRLLPRDLESQLFTRSDTAPQLGS